MIRNKLNAAEMIVNEVDSKKTRKEAFILPGSAFRRGLFFLIQAKGCVQGSDGKLCILGQDDTGDPDLGS